MVDAITFLITIATVIIHRNIVTKSAQHLHLICLPLLSMRVRTISGSLKSKSFPLKTLAQMY
jgi:hypothetical protein